VEAEEAEEEAEEEEEVVEEALPCLPHYLLPRRHHQEEMEGSRVKSRLCSLETEGKPTNSCTSSNSTNS
jgi:hypothetical protein